MPTACFYLKCSLSYRSQRPRQEWSILLILSPIRYSHPSSVYWRIDIMCGLSSPCLWSYSEQGLFLSPCLLFHSHPLHIPEHLCRRGIRGAIRSSNQIVSGDRPVDFVFGRGLHSLSHHQRLGDRHDRYLYGRLYLVFDRFRDRPFALVTGTKHLLNSGYQQHD